MATTPSAILIGKRFRAYDKTIRDIWEAYQFLEFYLPILHTAIKADTIPAFSMQGLTSRAVLQQSKKDTYGVISHIASQVLPDRSLIAAVSQTESFLQYLVSRVLHDFPAKLSTQGQTEQSGRDLKLLDIILNSVDKAEMLDRVVEERVRNLFYGNPADFFLKDKAKLEFGDHFATKAALALMRFTEIVARRNLLIHNEGRVDRKYLREVPNTKFTLGSRVTVDGQYLQEALNTLRGLAAAASTLVSDRIYKHKHHAGTKVAQRHRSFRP